MPYAIGENGLRGGIIAYDRGSYIDGWRYMEVIVSDGNDAVWGCPVISVGLTDNFRIGSGWQNTVSISNFLKGNPTRTEDLNITCEGTIFELAALKALNFNENPRLWNWVIPSNDEIQAIFQNLNQSDFVYDLFWTSNEVNENQAYAFDATLGVLKMISKNDKNPKLILIRYF